MRTARQQSLTISTPSPCTATASTPAVASLYDRLGARSGRLRAILARYAQQDVFRAGGIAFSINVAGALLAAVGQLMLARALGAVQFGLYSYAFAWVSLLSLLATAGFQQGLLRFGAVYVGQGGMRRLDRQLTRFACATSLLASALIALLALGLLWLLADRLASDLIETFVIALLVIPLLAQLRILSAKLRVLGRMAASLIPDLCLRELFLILTACLALAGVLPWIDARLTMGCVLLASLLGLAWVLWALNRAGTPARTGAGGFIRGTDKEIQEGTPPNPAREWLFASFFLLLFTTANLLQKRTDILVAGSILGTTEAGFYAVAMYLGGLVVFPQVALGVAFAPVVARLYESGRIAELQQIARRGAQIVLFCSIAIGGVLWAVAPSLLSLVGEEYSAGVVPLRILVLGHVVAASFGNVELLMTMTGNERRAASIMLVTSLLNVPLIWLWVSLAGLSGAAIGTVTILFVFKWICCVQVRRRVGILTLAFVRSQSRA